MSYWHSLFAGRPGVKPDLSYQSLLPALEDPSKSCFLLARTDAGEIRQITVPARMGMDEAVKVLGRTEDQLAILARHHLLPVLGEPERNEKKWLFRSEVLAMKADPHWLRAAGLIIQRAVREKNSKGDVTDLTKDR